MWLILTHIPLVFFFKSTYVYLKAGGATPGWAVSDLGAPALEGPEIGIGPSPMAECWAAAAAKNDPGAPAG